MKNEALFKELVIFFTWSTALTFNQIPNIFSSSLFVTHKNQTLRFAYIISIVDTE